MLAADDDDDDTTQEHTEVAEQFARFIASNQLSMDDVNLVLDEHTRSVHLLRIRQGDERQRLIDRLDAKRHARRTAAAAAVDEQARDDDRELGQASNDCDKAPKIACLGHVSTTSKLAFFCVPGSAYYSSRVVDCVLFYF